MYYYNKDVQRRIIFFVKKNEVIIIQLIYNLRIFYN